MKPEQVAFLRNLAQTILNASVYRIIWSLDLRVVAGVAVILAIALFATL